MIYPLIGNDLIGPTDPRPAGHPRHPGNDNWRSHRQNRRTRK